MPICKTCEAVFAAGSMGTISDHGTCIRHPHHRSGCDLLAAVKEKCQICTDLKRAVERAHGSDLWSDPALQEICPVETCQSKRLFTLTAGLRGWDASIGFEFEYQPENGENIFRASVRYRLLRSDSLVRTQLFDAPAAGTGDKSVLDGAYNWLRECRHNHQSCQWGSLYGTRPIVPIDVDDPAWLPTRLLDIDMPGAPNQFRVVRPVKGCGWQYITLSYRWGTDKHLQLQRTTQVSLFAGCQIDCLPKTFRDAIEVCRAFHIRYLWIDSLCIIQDSLEDWEAEAQNMSNVYARTTCNISATEMENPSVGLFRTRDSAVNAPLQVVLPQPLTFIRRGEGEHDLLEQWQFQHRIDDAPLNKRGWVLQERMLPPRILHFLDDRIAWECRTIATVEGYSNEMHNERLATIYPPRKILKFEKYVHNTASNDIGVSPRNGNCHLCTWWFKIVNLYNKCRFTVQDDKPWALLGLAKTVENITRDRYLAAAGLWKAHLQHQILWYVDGQEARKQGGILPEVERSSVPSGQTYRKWPSFSPFSLSDSQSCIAASVKESAFRILGAERLSLDGLEQRSGSTAQQGRLKIEGVLRRIRLCLTKQDQDEETLIYRPRTNAFQGTDSLEWAVLYPTYCNFDGRQRKSSGQHFMMYLGVESIDGILHRIRNRPLWLILELVDHEPATYRRLGTLSTVEKEDRSREAEDISLDDGHHPIGEQAPGTPVGEKGARVFYLV